MSDSTAAMQALYTRYVVSQPLDGALGAVADLLAEGTLSRETFDSVVADMGVGGSRAFRDGLLDLLLHCVREALRDHCLTADEAALIRQLAVTFRVREGEFSARRRSEMTAILQGEAHRLLADAVIDGPETAYLEELQRIFRLGYDEYLALVRDALTPVVDESISRAVAEGGATPEAVARFERSLSALRTVYVLSPVQRRALAGT